MSFTPKLHSILIRKEESWMLNLICNIACITQNKLLNSFRPQNLHA